MRSALLAALSFTGSASAYSFYLGTAYGEALSMSQSGADDKLNHNIIFGENDDICGAKAPKSAVPPNPGMYMEDNMPYINYCGDQQVGGKTYTLKGTCGSDKVVGRQGREAQPNDPYADLWRDGKQVGKCIFIKDPFNGKSCAHADLENSIGTDIRKAIVLCTDGQDGGGGSGYAPGRCSAHVTQYQRRENGIGNNFAFGMILKDNNGKQIGNLDRQGVDDNGHFSMSSQLPYTLDITVGKDDNDPVQFCYAGFCWKCDQGDGDNGTHCTLGKGAEHGYEDGRRQGDFSFGCGPPKAKRSSLHGRRQ